MPSTITRRNSHSSSLKVSWQYLSLMLEPPERFLEKVLDTLKYKDTIKYLYGMHCAGDKEPPFDFSKISEQLAQYLPKCEFFHVWHMHICNFRIKSQLPMNGLPRAPTRLPPFPHFLPPFPHLHRRAPKLLPLSQHLILWTHELLPEVFILLQPPSSPACIYDTVCFKLFATCV